MFASTIFSSQGVFEQGLIGFLPHNVYATWRWKRDAQPAGNGDVPAMVAGALAGKTVIALFAPLTALGLLRRAAFFSPGSGAVAAVLYLSTPWIIQVSTIGWVEERLPSTCLPRSTPWLSGSEATVPDRSRLPGWLATWLERHGHEVSRSIVRRCALTAWLVAQGCAPTATAWKRLPCLSPRGAGVWVVVCEELGLAGNPTYPMLYGLFGGGR